MKILYAFQGTGNGHVVRAQEIIPILKKYGTVDTLISGHQSQLNTDFPINFKHKGISLLYNKTGGISYQKILLKNNFLRFCVSAFDYKKINIQSCFRLRTRGGARWEAAGYRVRT